MHTNVILASLRVEVGSERVGATPKAWAEADRSGLWDAAPAVSKDRPLVGRELPGEGALFSGFFPS